MSTATLQAQTVWQVWRRIMREEDLQTALFKEPGRALDAQTLSAFGLRGEEAAAAQAYADQADRAKWFVLNYRFRLVNSFLNALETGAPLVLRALLNQEADVKALGSEFLDQCGWKDFGPYVYTYCAEALEFLSLHKVTECPKGLRDLIGLESAVVALMRDLVKLGPFPSETASQGPLRLSPYAKRYSSSHRLTVYLRDKKSIGRVDLEPLEAGQYEHFLVYLPDLSASHKYALIPPRATEILAALQTPCPVADLPMRLESLGFEGRTELDVQYLKQLRTQQAIMGGGN